jgi:hypothetical protein
MVMMARDSHAAMMQAAMMPTISHALRSEVPIGRNLLVMTYTVEVCPACGRQPFDGPNMYGEIHCSEHGAVEPWEVEVVPVDPSRVKAPRVEEYDRGFGSKGLRGMEARAIYFDEAVG